MSKLDAALNKFAEEIPGFPTAKDIEELELDVEYELNPWKQVGTSTEEPKSLTYWTVKPLHKKSIEEQEEYTKDGRTVTRKTGWRWGEWTAGCTVILTCMSGVHLKSLTKMDRLQRL